MKKIIYVSFRFFFILYFILLFLSSVSKNNSDVWNCLWSKLMNWIKQTMRMNKKRKIREKPEKIFYDFEVTITSFHWKMNWFSDENEWNTTQADIIDRRHFHIKINNHNTHAHKDLPQLKWTSRSLNSDSTYQLIYCLTRTYTFFINQILNDSSRLQ